MIEFLDALERKLDSSLQLFSWQQSFFGSSEKGTPEFADSQDIKESLASLPGQTGVDLYLWNLLSVEND